MQSMPVTLLCLSQNIFFWWHHKKPTYTSNKWEHRAYPTDSITNRNPGLSPQSCALPTHRSSLPRSILVPICHDPDAEQLFCWLTPNKNNNRYNKKNNNKSKQKLYRQTGAWATELIVELYSFWKVTWFYIYSPVLKMGKDIITDGVLGDLLKDTTLKWFILIKSFLPARRYHRAWTPEGPAFITHRAHFIQVEHFTIIRSN